MLRGTNCDTWNSTYTRPYSCQHCHVFCQPNLYFSPFSPLKIWIPSQTFLGVIILNLPDMLRKESHRRWQILHHTFVPALSKILVLFSSWYSVLFKRSYDSLRWINLLLLLFSSGSCQIRLVVMMTGIHLFAGYTIHLPCMISFDLHDKFRIVSTVKSYPATRILYHILSAMKNGP